MDNKELWTKYKSHCHNKGLTNSRINKLRTMFNMVTRGINKPLSEATEEDIRRFVNQLHSGEFRTQRTNEEYSGSTKADAKKFLKQFYKWLEGDRGRYPNKVVWLKTSIAKDEKPEQKRVITQDECYKLAESWKQNSIYRFTTYILFDSGFRVSEFQSVKKRHLTKEAYKDNEECWWIECQKSKTYQRKIPIPLFTPEINEFVDTAHYRALEPSDKLFQKTYKHLLETLKRHSKKVLGERITPHNFRHSSATLYASLLDGDLYALCDRYGWDYASNTPKTYIRKSGTRQKKTAQKVVNNQLQKTNKRVSELEEENQELKQRLKQVEDVINNVVN